VNGSHDVVIVGGGAIGGSVACFLLTDPTFDGTVAVIERDPTYALASSARSAASIRQQFSTPENIRMSQFSIGWLRDAGRNLAVDDEGGGTVDLGLVEDGYLYLATDATESALRQNHVVQRAEGADVDLLAPDDLRDRFPWLAVDDLVLGSLGRSGEGWFDGYALMAGFRRKARSLGATFVTAEAVGLRVRAGRVEAAELDDGSTLSGGTFVNAAGPWARRLAGFAGIDLPVEARRRSVFAFSSRLPLPACPLVIDPSGAWFRPEGPGFIGAIPPPEDEDLADLPLEVDSRRFEERLWPALAARVPVFDEIRVTNAWAGYYELNTFDHNAILGPHPEVPNLLFANGFSGHGLQHSPAVGRAIAELVVHGRYATLDLSVFGFERIAAGRRVVERNVIG
jgi:glycine/D-amino acid oxidase-like deaminating enzyme